MSTDPATTFGLGAIDQVSFAVRDAEDAARRWEPIFGPFEIMTVDLPAIEYRGRASSARLTLGFGRSGDIEIELVEVLEGDSPVADHLAEHGEGIHHVRFPVHDLAGKRAAMEAAHWTTIFAGEGGPVSYAYLEPPAEVGGTVIELIETRVNA